MVSLIKHHSNIFATSNSTVLKCMNTNLTWDSAYINAENNVFKNDSSVPVRRLIQLAGQVHSEFCIELKDLLKDDEM